ncbi:MAG: acyl-CoA dehydrogenase [Gammaproteobacteria bacterium RIFCSPHIGHO2_12_FULL_43_28]|nr:MAG: acyl-CoA dehydrogenase [Gammaproteobacteria bacterium RIFCSPHIGHO2_12_FULL_43_28]
MTWLIILLGVFGVLMYHRASLIVWTICYALLLTFAVNFYGMTVVTITGTLLFLLIFVPLNLFPLRRRLLSEPVFRLYRNIMPTMSRTEQEAIAAGTVTWEGDLFRGNPNWDKLLALPPATLSAEEQAFIDGPVDKLCQMLDDWDITRNRADLTEETWQFIKDEGFFALIIPKTYGGKAFSAYAHSQILTKISGRSVTASTTVAVPNSLGPAELLLHYGTEEQKNYYLPRLAKGIEIPCFALTSSYAGSDAGSMTDYGIVCYGEYRGEKTLGIRINCDKRYITLAPVATVIGLAFKLYDPDHLIGKKHDIGITCALIPRETPGITIGRRHFPLDTPFQNGPIQGKDVFIPMEWVIGGEKQVGNGWRMLMECLAAGRAITLPASTLGGAKLLCYAGGAYARIRKQFNLPIGRFEGIEEPLARTTAFTYIMDAARTLAAGSIDLGEKPAIASAIIKYHVTELGRKIACDAMDIHGGKGICLGPRNYLGRGYESAPIAITVEGANILTRSMIIFGQGAIRCHPYVLAELDAAHMEDTHAGLVAFDKALMKHINFAISNIVRSFVLALTGSRIVKAPHGKTRRYFQHMTRFSSALALFSDVAMLTLGGSLKRKESISARLGDILSHLYLLSAVLKHYHVQGRHADDLPIVRYASEYCLFEIQDRFEGLIENFPSRWIAKLMHFIIFPVGKHFLRPHDKLNHQIAQLVMAPTETRERLAAGAYITAVKENAIAEVQDALLKTIAAEPVEAIIKTAMRDKLVTGYTLPQQAQSALENGIITTQQFDLFIQADAARRKVIAVDDFTTEELVGRRMEEGSQQRHADSNGATG